MSAVFMLKREDVGRWTWYAPRVGKRASRRRRHSIRDGEPRLVGELILAGILEGV